MPELLLALGLGLGGAALVYYWRVARPRQAGRERLAAALAVEEEAPPPRARPFVRRLHWLPWLVGGGVAALLALPGAVPTRLALTFGLVAGLLAWQWELARVVRRQLLIETQLADALDLMIGNLRAGGSLLSALDGALTETRPPLRPQLEEVLGRIRYGDNPQAVFQGLADRVPLETFRLLTTALAVHWEVGGSLAPALATVARAIRDRIELSRRVRSLTTEARVSLLAVLAMTYFIALIMWLSDPVRMATFLATNVGSALVSAAVLLQGLGIVWAASISRMKY